MSSDIDRRVVALQGVPVSTTPPTSGKFLGWNGSAWAPLSLPAGPTTLPPSGPAGGDLHGTYPNPTITQLTGDLGAGSGGGTLVEVPTSSGGSGLTIDMGNGNPTAFVTIFELWENSNPFFTVQSFPPGSGTIASLTIGGNGGITTDAVGNWTMGVGPALKLQAQTSVALEVGYPPTTSITLSSGAVDAEGVTTTTTSPAAGPAGALPATPAGYLEVIINGTLRYLPYY